MKKVVGLAAAGLLGVSAANAGQITVANTDITLFGGVSAGYNLQDNDHQLRSKISPKGFEKDSFSVNNVIIGLTKPAQDGGIGFTAAFGSWEAPTVVASSKVVNGKGLIGYGDSTTFKPWLAYVTYKPVAGLTLDAGLLWSQFGEKPVTILNPHITRGVLFTANPALMAGARGTYDFGVAKVYVGAGKVGDQLMKPVFEGKASALGNGYAKSYMEAGVTANLKQFGLPADVGLHTYNEAGGRDIYALTAGTDLGMVSLGVEVDYFVADKNLKNYSNGTKKYDSNAWGAALCANIKPMAGVQIPVRIEYADTKKSILIPTIAAENTINKTPEKNSVWTFTITPTYNPTKNTFLRAEVSYVGSDKKIFINTSGKEKSSRTTGAVELGFLF
ncbi:MAG: outer membrane beta-barrel protein [Hydrogenothermaceae bacterium]